MIFYFLFFVAAEDEPSSSIYHVTKHNCRDIFGNLDQIFQLNTKFLFELEFNFAEFYVGPTESQIIILANIFKLYASQFKIYTLYTSNFSNSRNFLVELCHENCYENLRNFISTVTSASCTKGNDLNSFLIMPVQRMYDYFYFNSNI